MDNYAMYLRKSRADLELEESGAGETLERHYKILTGLAEKMGIRIVEVYKELVSGESISSRPEMQRLLDDVYMRKYKGVVVMELERLARGDKKDQGIVEEAFTYSNTLIITPQKIYNPNDEVDNDYFSFGLFMSQREYKTIKRRLMTGIRASAKEGNFVGSQAPYGYDAVRINKKERILVPNEQADVVRMIFDMYVNRNYGILKIASILTDRGIKPLRGGTIWSKFTIKSILTNPTYVGKIHWDTTKTYKVYEDGQLIKKKMKNQDGTEILVNGKHEAIIDEELFVKAQERITPSHTIGKRELRNVFAGLMVCKNCGRTMIVKQYKYKGREFYCIAHPAVGKCKQRQHDYDDIVSSVVESLKNGIKDFEIKMKYENQEQEKALHEKNLKLLETNISKLENKVSKLYDFLEDGVYSKDEFLERKENLDKKISSAKEELEKEKSVQFVDYREKAFRIHSVLDSLLDDKISAKDKNTLLKGIVERITYENVDGDVQLEIFYK